MTEKNTGGPAFPQDRRNTNGDGIQYCGMTLPDYFAAPAPEEDIQEHIWKGHKEQFVVNDCLGKSSIAIRDARWTREEAKYRYADAMLRARGEDQPEAQRFTCKSKYWI